MNVTDDNPAMPDNLLRKHWGNGRRKDHIEIYDRSRFFAWTGNHLPGTPLTIEVKRPTGERSLVSFWYVWQGVTHLGVQVPYGPDKGNQRKATHWLGTIARHEPKLFAHWQLGGLPAAG